MYRFLVSIVTFYVLGLLGISAQNVMLFNSKQGLSNSCIHTIYEDSRHNIWITTQNGLNRYDGLKINVYRHDEKQKGSLLHDDVTYVKEYDHNHIIVGTGFGLQMYDYASDTFQQIPLLDEKGDTTKCRIIEIDRIKENGKERIILGYAGFGNGELFRGENGSYYCKRIQDFKVDDENNSAIQLMQDSRQRFWVLQMTRKMYLKEGKRMRLVPGVENVYKFAESATGHIYAATTYNGLYRYDEKQKRFVQVAAMAELGGSIYGLNPWRDTRMFVCTDGGGLRIYDEKTDKVTQSTISVNNFDLSTSNVKDAICDSFGNVWVGIYWVGVMMKPHNQTSFDYVGRNSITKNTIGTKSVFTLAKADNSHLWISPDNDGLYLLAKDGTSSVHYTAANGPKAFTAIRPVEGRLLLGTFMDGLWQRQGESFSLITKDINQIFEIKPADNGNVWIASVGHGFFYYDVKTGKYIQYAPDWSKGEDGAKIIGNAYVFTILQHNNKVYVGTSDGMNICKYRGGGLITEKSRKLLNGYGINHIVLSSDDRYIWAATNNGLVRIDARNYNIKRYSTSEGLANNVVKSLCYEDGKLWASTDNGISLFDTKTEKFTNFFSDDGLQDNEFNRGSVLTLGGNLYFGGISGLTYFNSRNIEKRQKENTQLRLMLVDLSIGGRIMHQGDRSGSYEVMDGVLDDCTEINLSSHDNHFVLDLCVEGLLNQHINYEYRINGGEWTNQGGLNNRIVFDNLAPGTYNIHIRAHALGAISEERVIKVIVHPAWYASWWARLVYLLLLALVCYLVYLYVQRQLKARRILARHRQEQEINEARIQFFMNISHEIRTPMTLIFAPIERLISTDKDPEHQRNYSIVKQNANRILRLINQMMDVRKIEQGKFLLDYHKVELVSLLQNTFDVFESKAQSHHIEYTFSHEGLHSLNAIVDPENVDKIVMNLLSNAFKFTPDGGKIVLKLTAPLLSSGHLPHEGEEGHPESFELSVTDTGCGISDEEKSKVFDRFYSASHKNGYIGTGIGLNLTSMLVKLHKGTINVTDNPEGQGTSFIVKAPLRPMGTSPEWEESHPESKPTERKITTNFDYPEASLPLGGAGRGLLVLVEDDASIREYVSVELSHDFRVHEFIDGQQAWDYVIAHPDEIDLVISDIMMPVMDGLTLCQKVKSNFNTNHIPILLMTALGSDADRIVGITNGADAYISKPFNIDVLKSTALGLLHNRQLLQGRFTGEKIQQEETGQIHIESPDEQFMRRVMEVINENMDNDELSVELIADKVGISRVHFYRKMKDLTGQGPREYVKYVRLKEAARLLSTKKMDITGVSIACGFKTSSSFSTSFKALYGVTPTEWVRQHNQ